MRHSTVLCKGKPCLWRDLCKTTDFPPPVMSFHTYYQQLSVFFLHRWWWAGFCLRPDTLCLFSADMVVLLSALAAVWHCQIFRR